jgi:hypothetical protein
MKANNTLYFNSYDPCNLSDLQWKEDINKHNQAYNTMKDAETMNETELNYLIDNGYNFWITIVNDNPYYHKDSYLVDITLTYINRPTTLYINKDIINKHMQPTLHWYEYKLRGFSPFCQPKGHIQHDESKGRWGIIAYDRELTPNELEEYDLKKWEVA